MFRSIRWTLQLWHAGILVLALVSFGAAMYLQVRRSDFRQIDAELAGAAHFLGSMPPFPPEVRRRMRMRSDDEPFHHFEPHPEDMVIIHRPDPSDRPDLFASLPMDVLHLVGQDERDQPYFVVWGANGSVLRSSLPPSQIPPEPQTGVTAEPPDRPESTEFRSRGDSREVSVPGPFRTRVLVGRSMQRETERLHHLLWLLFGAGAGILGIGLVGGRLLSERAIRPIRAIAATAGAISATDLSRRIDLKETQSELGALGKTLNDMFARLESAFDRQIRFTADASHELRTPLTVIHSNAELALSRERTAAEYHKTLETCLRASRRMKSLVDALLVLARADAGRLELKRAPLDLAEVVEESAAMMRPLAATRGITIELHAEPVRVSADRTRVAQLVTNLISNAIQYNRDGGSVRLEVAPRNGQAEFVVADTGIGITPEDQVHLFDRFFRADKARSRESGGSGLGLAICRSIVEAHGGEIAVRSEPDRGTTFFVRLPIVETQDGLT